MTGTLPPEIAFLVSPIGGGLVILISTALFILTLFWGRRPDHPDRPAAVLGAAGTSLLVAALSILAVRAGWWQGAFLQVPWPVGLAIYLPFSIAGYTAWLGIYRLLRRRVRRAFRAYLCVVLIFIPIVLLVDPVQMNRGQFQMASGYTIWMDALMGQLVMLSPVLFYEFFLRMRSPSTPGLPSHN